jgi:hypothetical protein
MEAQNSCLYVAMPGPTWRCMGAARAGIRVCGGLTGGVLVQLGGRIAYGCTSVQRFM